MKLTSLKPLLAAGSCAVLAACQTAPQNASLQCGAAGALGGYALCKLLGHSDSECAKVAVVTGVGGAAICYGYAANLERRRKELSGREGSLEAQLNYVRGLNEETAKLNAQLSQRAADVTRQTDDLVAQIRQKRVSDAELAKARRDREDEVKAANLQVAKGAEALNEVKAYRTKYKPASPQLDADIARQEQLLADSRRQVDLLASQQARV